MVKNKNLTINDLKSLEEQIEISLEETALLKSVISELLRIMIEEEQFN